MRKDLRVALSPGAEQDINRAWEWIAATDPWAADHWEEGLLNAIKSLSLMPERYPLSPETRHGYFPGEMRQMLHGAGYWKYRVLFTVQEDAVLVLHVRHGARRYAGEEASLDDERDAD